MQDDVKPVAATYAELETRTMALLQRYNNYVRPLPPSLLSSRLRRLRLTQRPPHRAQISTMSELFVSWDDILTDAEAQVARLERERRARDDYDIA